MPSRVLFFAILLLEGSYSLSQAIEPGLRERIVRYEAFYGALQNSSLGDYLQTSSETSLEMLTASLDKKRDAVRQAMMRKVGEKEAASFPSPQPIDPKIVFTRIICPAAMRNYPDPKMVSWLRFRDGKGNRGLIWSILFGTNPTKAYAITLIKVKNVWRVNGVEIHAKGSGEKSFVSFGHTDARSGPDEKQIQEIHKELLSLQR